MWINWLFWAGEVTLANLGTRGFFIENIDSKSLPKKLLCPFLLSGRMEVFYLLIFLWSFEKVFQNFFLSLSLARWFLWQAEGKKLTQLHENEMCVCFLQIVMHAGSKKRGRKRREPNKWTQMTNKFFSSSTRWNIDLHPNKRDQEDRLTPMEVRWTCPM